MQIQPNTKKVKLVSLTQSLILEKELTPEELIVYIARVSNPSNQLNTESSSGLVRYLIINHHWSPFELVDMTVEIKTSRAIAAQILRHRSFSFQEFSQRYAKVNDMEPVQLRRQAVKNRQSSSKEFDPEIIIKNSVEQFKIIAGSAIQSYIEQGQELYNSLIDADVAKEVARMVLPLTTQTTIYMKGSIRSWIHYFAIRCDEHTQKEHRDIANQIRYIFDKHFPSISEALNSFPQ